MEGDPEAKANTMWRMIKEFMSGVGLGAGDAETDDFMGLEFSAYLTLTQDQKGRPVNEIQRIT
jgi:hypothetical protein